MRHVGFPGNLTRGRSCHEAQKVYGRTDHLDPEGARSRRLGAGHRSPAWVAENTVYRWKSKFGGMEVSEAKRLRELEAENAKLKRLLGEAELDKTALKELVEGKW
jgi:transposase